MNQIKDLLNLNIHLGRKVNEWHPKMLPFIYSESNGMHVLNVFQTEQLLIKAKKFLKQQIDNNTNILFVGTKKSAISIIEKKANLLNQFCINNSWLPGLLTNWETTKDQIATLNLLEFEKKKDSFALLTKKERSLKFKKLLVLNKYLKGIRYMKNLPSVLVVVDSQIEKIAIEEAKKLKIKVIALIDSNTNPNNIDYPIPSNTDSPKSIYYIFEELFNFNR